MDIFEPKQGQSVTAVAEQQERRAEDALTTALAGMQEQKIAGVPVRPFTFADWSMLKRLGSHFVASGPSETDEVIESISLFIHVVSAKRSLREMLEITFSKSRQEIMIDALVEVGAGLSEPKKTVDAIYSYISAATITRVEVAPSAGTASKKNGG